MHFLADESCDFSVVRALRFAGHDVVAIAEVSPREEDDDVRERAVAANCILITEDKDFGQLVYANMRRTGGVIFIRFPANSSMFKCSKSDWNEDFYVSGILETSKRSRICSIG